MKRLQAFKYELMLDGEQQRDMRRFVYRKALAMQQENREAGNQFIGYVAMAKQLTGWRNGPDTPWLKDAPCRPLQHALNDLEVVGAINILARGHRAVTCGESVQSGRSMKQEPTEATRWNAA